MPRPATGMRLFLSSAAMLGMGLLGPTHEPDVVRASLAQGPGGGFGLAMFLSPVIVLNLAERQAAPESLKKDKAAEGSRRRVTAASGAYSAASMLAPATD